MINAHAGAGGHGLLAVLVVCALAACGQKRVHRPGEEWLAAIRFEGNTALGDAKLREGLALRRVEDSDGAPDPYVVIVDAERIQGEYIRAGFLEVDVRPRVERRGDATTVIYTIVEGPRATSRVMLTGIPDDDPELTEEMVRDVLPIEDGEPFSYEPYGEAKERLLALAENAGYAYAQLDAHVIVDRINHEAIVHLDYNLGPKCRFGTIEVTGVERELAEAARARVAFETGDIYSAAAIAETQRNLYDMRRFSMVRVIPDTSSGDDIIDVKLSLSRSARNQVVAGGGIGVDPTTYQVRGRTGYSRLGFPFPLTDFSLDLRPAYARMRDNTGYGPRVRALATLRRIDLFRPFVTGELQAGYDYLTLEAYMSYGPRASAGIEAPVFVHPLRLRVGWELERIKFRNVSEVIDPARAMELGLDETQRIGKYTQALLLDLRDSPLEPTRGVYAELRADEGTPLAGGQLEYLRITPELRGFVPVPFVPLVLAARVRGGRIYGDVAVTERYLSGGSTRHRGFGERRLAPSASGVIENEMITVPMGGAELFESNFEVRSRITTVRGIGVGGVVFLDGGDVVDVGEQIDLGHLHWAIGLGLRLYTIVGPIRADVGYRVNRTGPGEPDAGARFAFHVSIGEAF